MNSASLENIVLIPISQVYIYVEERLNHRVHLVAFATEWNLYT